MKVTECDAQIEQSLAKLPDRSAGVKLQPKVKKCHRKPNTLRFEAIEPVFRAMGVDLTAIEGIEAHTALVILGEIGVDVASSPPRSILRVGWAYAPTIKRATASGNRGGCGRGRTGWRSRCGWRRGRCNARTRRWELIFGV